MTENERDAALLRAGGLSWGEVQQAFLEEGSNVSRSAVNSYAIRGRDKLRAAYLKESTDLADTTAIGIGGH